MNRVAAVLIVVGVSRAGIALAGETAPSIGSDARLAAAESFYQRGRAESDQQDYQGALLDFERARQIYETRHVLLAIGATYLRLNRPEKALPCLRKVVDPTSDLPRDLDRDTLANAQTSLEKTEKMITRLTVTTTVAGAQVEVDGALLDGVTQAPSFSLTVETGPGEHTVGVRLSGYRPRRDRILVVGEQMNHQVVLDQEKDKQAPSWAFVELTTNLPEVTVDMDDEPLATTPVGEPLAVPAGSHRFVFSRRGYVARSETVRLVPGQQRRMNVALSEDAGHRAPRGVLALAIEPDEADVAVDGGPPRVYRTPLSLLVGRHHLTIESGGYRAVELEANVQDPPIAPINVHLRLTPEERARRAQSARGRRAWGVGAAVGGALLAGAGAVVFLHYRSAHAEADRQLAATNDSFKKGAGGRCDYSLDVDHIACQAALAQAQHRVDETSAWRTGGGVGVVVGIMAAVVGGLVAATSRPPADLGGDLVLESPSTPLAGPLGAGIRLALRGSF